MGMLSCSISFRLGDVIMVVPYERRAEINISVDVTKFSYLL